MFNFTKYLKKSSNGHVFAQLLLNVLILLFGQEQLNFMLL